MAQLDNFFNYLKKHKGSELFLQSESEPTIKISGKLKAITKQKLSYNQIFLLIKEIAPSEDLEDLKSKGSVDFVYKSPAGPFKGLISIKDKNVKANFTPQVLDEKEILPESGEEEPIELEGEAEAVALEEGKETVEFQEEAETVELWHWVLFLLALVVIAESILGNMHLTPRRMERA